MDESIAVTVPITQNQSSLPIQKKESFDLMTNEEREKRIAEIDAKIAEGKLIIAEIQRKQQIIDNSFASFEKCIIRYVETKDDNGNEIKGNKVKDKADSLEKLNQLTATQDRLLCYSIIDGATAAQPQNKTHETQINVVYQVLADGEPADSIEAKLILQEHTLYSQGMQYLARAESSNKFSQGEYYMKNAIKLLRLHNETIETISRYRRKGEQRVIVQHQSVTIENGAQGIVNNGQMSTGGGGK